MTTIKEHIEQGHYPRDDKGRALVSSANGTTWAIVRTDNGGPRPLVGMKVAGGGKWDGWQDWDETGCARSSDFRLLPPPPRKVPLEFDLRWNGTMWIVATWTQQAGSRAMPTKARVTATAEYEESWP